MDMFRKMRGLRCLVILVVLSLAFSFIPMMDLGAERDGTVDAPDPEVNSRDGLNKQSILWGFVTDMGDNPIVNARIEMAMVGEVSLKRTTFSQTGGYYSIEVPPGTYDVKVTKNGFFETGDRIKLFRGTTVRYDWVLEKIPPITSSVRGKVTDNATTLPVQGATVFIFDILRNYSINDTTNIIGNYNLDIYSGNFIIMVIAGGYLPKFFGGITVEPDQDLILNIDIYPMPVMDARIIGDVTNEKTGEGIPKAKITLIDHEKDFFTEITADGTGHFDFDMYEGDFFFLVSDDSSDALDSIPRNVTASSSAVTVENFKLPELPPSHSSHTITFTDWNNGVAKFNMTSWGRSDDGSGGAVRNLRFMVDFFLGDGDLYASYSEVEAFIAQYEMEMRNDFGLYDTSDQFLLDGIDFLFADDFSYMEIDMTGSVFSDKPQYIEFEIEVSSNKTIDEGSPIHSILINQSYNSVNQTEEMIVHFPVDFKLTNVSIPTGYVLEEISNGTLTLSPPLDPDPNDDVRNQIITFDMIDRHPPVADAGGDLTVDEDIVVELNASGSSDNFAIEYYLWDLGDGNISNVTSPITDHVYEQPGVYTVDLKVVDHVGWEDTDTIQVEVLDVTPPVISIIVDNTTVEEDVVVHFEANASDNVEITLVQWSLDGRYLVNGTDLNHTFEEPGTYVIKVEVTDTSNHSVEAEVGMTVTDETPPLADTGGDRSVDESEEITFDASLSSDNVGITSIIWDFGDGSINVTGEISTHKYDIPGNYTVTLTVKDAAGHSDRSQAWVLVKDITFPQADIVAKKTSIVLGTKAEFNGSGSTDNVGIVEYIWDFGDGKNATGDIVSHKFKEVGSYKVMLTVRDETGWEDNSTLVVEVYEPEHPLLNAFCISMIFVLVFIGGIGSYIMFRKWRLGGYNIEEVFVIYEDGRLIRHISTHSQDSVDKDVIASMLTAVQEFVKDSLRKKEGEFMGKLEFGKKTKILIEKGDKIYLAIVLTGHDPEKLRGTLLKYVKEIEKKHGAQLQDWDGDTSVFEGLDEEVIELIEK